MFQLNDTFNNRVISQHRTLKAAALAEVAHSKAVRKANGQQSYIPTSITMDGERLTDEQNEQAMQIVHDAQF